MKTTIRLAALSGLTLALAASCVGGDGIRLPSESDETGPGKDGSPAAWDPSGEAGECNIDALLKPQSYGAKVKTLLTGLPLTDAELTSLREAPTGLAEMIDGWVSMPESETVLERFFMTALQQTGGNNESIFYLMDQTNTSTGFYSNPRSANADEMLNQNFSESFARTVTVMNRDGRPFSEILSTDTVMMTTAMMSFLAYGDDEVIDDNGDHTVRITAGDFDTITLVRDQVDAPPVSQALNPNSPNFATFWHPRLASQLDATACNVLASQTVDTTQNVNGEWRLSRGPSFFVFSAVALGRMQSIRRHNQSNCTTNASNIAPLLDRADFSDWRMVQVRKPVGVETPAVFYRAADLRATSELLVNTPRIGFFTAPGFLSTWLTNEDNSGRVSINQTLIVALGSSFEGVAVSNFAPNGLDLEHVASECYGCHQGLDPMRDYFRASLTNFYGEQLDPERTALGADFVFGNVQEQGVGLADLSNTLKDHPLFPYAWAHKLCYYANASACAEGAELKRVVDAFVSSGLQFQVLLRELFSSPLITGAECVSGVDAGTSTTIARRSTFCSSLSHRMGVDDLCGVRTNSRDADNLQNDVRDAVASVPDDSFSRAEVRPVVIAETGLFTRANREAACAIAAQDGFDQATFAGLSIDEVVDQLLEGVMGLPLSDSRHDAARLVVVEHIDAVVASGESEQVALQSALALACMSPGAAGIGF